MPTDYRIEFKSAFDYGWIRADGKKSGATART